jgi:hypothetical protein
MAKQKRYKCINKSTGKPFEATEAMLQHYQDNPQDAFKIEVICEIQDEKPPAQDIKKDFNEFLQKVEKGKKTPPPSDKKIIPASNPIAPMPVIPPQNGIAEKAKHDPVQDETYTIEEKKETTPAVVKSQSTNKSHHKPSNNGKKNSQKKGGANRK